MPRTLRSERSSTAVVVQTRPRAAIYTRKSTSEGLTREFNTLDNQRERGAAYAASQDWSLIDERYDDGGFSGKTIDRPALQRLLADAERRLFDIIVVYKLDRLSRSLFDFVNLHRILGTLGVEVVSVTEPIDTRTPMGRAFVNILVSFGQMEREQTAERTRDKLAGARRHGRFTGGTLVLGYDRDPSGGRLLVNEPEAESVRAIFRLFVEHRSLVATLQEIHRRGWTLKRWVTKQGRTYGGGQFDKGTLRRLLTNYTYIGKVEFQGTVYDGEHTGIVPVPLFREVQKILADNKRDPHASRPNVHGALLRGLIRCASCDRVMSHQWTRSRNRLHRYYVCKRAMTAGWAACATKSIPALAVEQFVVDQIKRIGADPALCDETFRQVQAQVEAERRGLKAEAKRVDRELATVRSELDRLTATLTRATGAAADALMAKVAETQERMMSLARRQREVGDRQAQLNEQDVDPAAVGRALAQFTDLWDVLLAPERERVVRLIIDDIQYNGAGESLTITFSSVGANLLAAEMSS